VANTTWNFVAVACRLGGFLVPDGDATALELGGVDRVVDGLLDFFGGAVRGDDGGGFVAPPTTFSCGGGVDFCLLIVAQ
jgi:hypothetical protein